MIVFIVVAAVALPVIVSPVMTLLKDSTKPEKAVTANFLGQKILEVITANDSPTLTGTSTYPITQPVIDTSSCSWPFDYTYAWDLYYINPVSPDYDLETEELSATKYVRIDITVTDPDSTDYNYYSIVTKRKKDAVAE